MDSSKRELAHESLERNAVWSLEMELLNYGKFQRGYEVILVFDGQIYTKNLAVPIEEAITNLVS